MGEEHQFSQEALEDFSLGVWRVQPSRNRLERGAEATRVEPKLMDVLLFLSRNAGRVVSKEEIVEAVWPQVFITESVITRAIAGLRRALGDDARSPRFIETIAKRGYRLLVQPVRRPAALNLPQASGASAPLRQPAEAGPFVVGQWVRGARFFGRAAEIREILRGQRNGIWVLGCRAVGKTSLLKQLEHLTIDDEEGGYFPLFWDLQGSVEPEDLHQDFAAALAEAEERLAAVGLRLGSVQAEDFFASLGRLRRGLRSQGRTLLLLWDEVEELIHLHGRWPVLLRKLRRALQSQEGIRTVLASGPRLWQLGAQRDDTSPFLHGFAPPLYLGPLANEAAVKLLAQAKLANGGAFEDPAVVSALLRRSGSHPSLLQLLSMCFQDTGDLEAATAAVAADLTVRYFFAVDFDLLTPLEREILLTLAAREGPTPVASLKLGPAPELASRLLHLERLGQLRRLPGDLVEISSSILCRWLQQKGAGA